LWPRPGAQPPSADHWLGTDPLSRDLLSRLLFGARISLGISVIAVTVATVVGTAWGATAGYAGGWIDRVLMHLVDAGLAIPRILLLLGIVALWGTLSMSRRVADRSPDGSVPAGSSAQKCARRASGLRDRRARLALRHLVLVRRFAARDDADARGRYAR
jgi:ABC-type dipeptide/oligopeptide/nickel transport system permease subunit